MNYYFHIPFCRRKCGYCAFYSEVAPAPELIDAYLDKLERDLRVDCPERCESIYFGGGTPTLLDHRRLERLFQLVKTRLAPDPECEISIEANPETLDAAKVALLRENVTRISLGVQSFSPRLRERIGRDCRQPVLEEVLELVAAAEFPHWNCDLIYNIPGQSVGAWRQELVRALELPIDHLSCYSLSSEERSWLGRELATDDELSTEMFTLAGGMLRERLPRYEISNYAAPGGECRHNLAVWRGGRLRGFGPTASGFDGVNRYTAADSLRGWLAGEPESCDRISAARRRDEIFVMNLRTVTGWTPELWSAVPGAAAEPWERRFARFAAAVAEMPSPWFAASSGRIALTEAGLLFWDTVAEALI